MGVKKGMGVGKVKRVGSGAAKNMTASKPTSSKGSRKTHMRGFDHTVTEQKFTKD